MNPIKITSQKFFKELSTASVDFLLGNVGDKIRIETVVSVQNYAISSPDSPFILNNTSGMVGTGWVKDDLAQFVNFKVGDTIIAYNQLALSYDSHTITAKLDNANIQVNPAFGGGNDNAATNFIISNTTPITSIKYHYNFIENGSGISYLSPVDGSEQLFVKEYKVASDTSVDPMKPNGPLTWQNGNVTIEGVSIDPGTTDGVYKSNYKIIHYTKIPPFVLYNQVENELSGIAPDNFQTTKCWKFISFIEAAINYTDPNFLVSEDFDGIIGNTGYYGENYNTGKTNYSISNVLYKNAGATIDSIQLDATETTVTFNIENATDTPFSNNNTKFVLGIFKVPADPAEYQNNNTLLDVNFLYDRALQTVGSAVVNGDNYATAYKFLTDIKGEFVSTSKIKITAKINMATAVIAGFSASSLPQYFMFVSVQNHTLATGAALNDLVSLKVGMEEFSVVSTDQTMIVANNRFLRHPESDPVNEGVALAFGPNSLSTENITTANAPAGMAFDGDNQVYTVNPGNTVTVINATTKAVITTISDANFNLPFHIAFDSLHSRMYVSNAGNGKISVISTVTNTVISTITGVTGAYGIAFSPVNNYMYCCKPGAAAVDVINTVTNTVIQTITVGANPSEITYNPLTDVMYVPCAGPDAISVIDCATNLVSQTIALTAGDNPTDSAYNSFSKCLYVLCTGPDVIKIINCASGTVTGTITGIDGFFIAYNTTDNQIITANSTQIVIINCSDNTIYNTIELSTTIYDILFLVDEYQILVCDYDNVRVVAITSSFDVFPEDEIVACSDFYIESAGRTADEIKLTSLQARVIASDGTNEFELDGFTIQLNPYPLVGYTQQFDAQVARGFHIPVGTIRKYIEVKRRNDLDTGTRKYFSSNYPFLWRWETWTKALGVNSDFFDSSLPNNGFNHWWFHYKTGDWKLHYKLIINATKNGTPQRFILENRITPHDYNSNADWTTKTIVTKDADTLVSLVTGGTTYVDTTRDTLIIATWTKSTLPANYHVEIGIEVWESGGYLGKRMYSSRWDWSADTWFKSTDGSNKVELSITGNTVTAKVILDYTKLPGNITSYKLSSRMYEGIVQGIATDDDVQITTDDGVFITID